MHKSARDRQTERERVWETRVHKKRECDEKQHNVWYVCYLSSSFFSMVSTVNGPHYYIHIHTAVPNRYKTDTNERERGDEDNDRTFFLTSHLPFHYYHTYQQPFALRRPRP
jgi:hypothetical protein